jgi:hypothetical protein
MPGFNGSLYPYGKKRPYRRRLHIYDGFPHFSNEFPYHCMCLAECCQDMRPADGKGCVCPHCPCQHGIPHDREAV